MDFSAKKPYPEIKVEKKDDYYAKILSHVYASNESELSAILQYSYQTFLMPKSEISNIIKKIAEVEMRHLEILGKIISLLGTMPIFADRSYCNETYWNSDFIYYDTDIKTILEVNIETEKANIRNYQMLIHVIDDKYIKEMLKRILEDEYIHLETFMKLKLKYA